jgi:glycosyltransferase involved in cell wall biosynthesis
MDRGLSTGLLAARDWPLMTTFSVAICTRNRAALLPRVVRAAFDQNYAKDRYEVLVVDNGSTDDTSAVAAALAAEATVPFRVVVEPRPGVSTARNTAALEARHEFVAYLDDDTVPDRNWLKAFGETIQEHGALVVGGRVDDVFEDDFELPSWFMCPYLRSFFRLEHDSRPSVFRLQYPAYIGEGNCAYARHLFGRFRFPPALGAGNRRASGGGALLDLTLEQQGVPMYYTDHAVVRHLVGSQRIVRRNFLKAAWLHGIELAFLELIAKGRLRSVFGFTRHQLRRAREETAFCTVCKLVKLTSFVLESLRLHLLRRLGIEDPGGHRRSVLRSAGS